MSTEIELAWAVGLFEGEGTFHLDRQRSSPRAALVMADEEIVRRFHEIVGVGRVCVERRAHRAAHHKTMYRWQITNREDFLTLVALLMPYLGSRKREQLVTVLDGIAAKKPHTLALEGKRERLLAQLRR